MSKDSDQDQLERSQRYNEFKARTIEATDTISKAHNMRALSDDFVDGFAKAMWEAREIFMRLEDEADLAPKPNKVKEL